MRHKLARDLAAGDVLAPATGDEPRREVAGVRRPTGGAVVIVSLKLPSGHVVTDALSLLASDTVRTWN